MIPLPRAARLLGSCSTQITDGLSSGDAPSWQALDHLADAISGVDYYLERLLEENGFGAEDILDMAERSLESLGAVAPATTVPEGVAAAVPEETAQPQATEEDATADAGLAAEDADEDAEPRLELETDAGFDLENDIFDGLASAADEPPVAATDTTIADDALLAAEGPPTATDTTVAMKEDPAAAGAVEKSIVIHA